MKHFRGRTSSSFVLLFCSLGMKRGLCSSACTFLKEQAYGSQVNNSNLKTHTRWRGGDGRTPYIANDRLKQGRTQMLIRMKTAIIPKPGATHPLKSLYYLARRGLADTLSPKPIQQNNIMIPYSTDLTFLPDR